MHKKSFCATILISVLISGFSAHAFADQALVTGNEVNVRTGPGTAYSIFSSLSRDMTVEVVNRSNPDWYLVSWDGSSGYVSSQFLDLQEENSSAEIAVSMDETPGYINGMYVCLRSGPDTSSTILGTYSTGKTLTITGTTGDWTAVRLDNKEGFVFSQFISEGDPHAAAVEFDESTKRGTSISLSDSGSQNLVVESGSTVFTVRESPGLSDTDTTSENYIVEVPTDGVSYSGESEYFIENAPESGNMLAVDLPVDSENGEPESADSAPSSSAVAPASTSTADVPAATGEEHSSDLQAVRVGKIKGNVVRLRSGPGTTFSIIGTYDNDTEVVIAGVSEDWTAVTIPATGVSGYIHSDYIEAATDADTYDRDQSASESTAVSHPVSFKITDGYITGSSVRLREAPSMSAKILDELNYGTSVRMIGISDDWYRVIVNGKEGYVSASFVTEGTYAPAAQLSEATGTELGKEIAAYALQYVGSPYKWGGHSPETGFDCSGFVQYVYGQFGYTTSRVANDALSDGVHVDPADLQPGDLLCFYSGNNYVGHLGIYIGDDMFVHAANSATGVVTTSLTTGYYAIRGYEIRRVT